MTWIYLEYILHDIISWIFIHIYIYSQNLVINPIHDYNKRLWSKAWYSVIWAGARMNWSSKMLMFCPNRSESVHQPILEQTPLCTFWVTDYTFNHVHNHNNNLVTNPIHSATTVYIGNRVMILSALGVLPITITNNLKFKSNLQEQENW